MGSYQQLVVGGVLLVIAFLFGKYVTSQQSASTTRNEVQAKTSVRNTEPEADSTAKTTNSLQRSLRDRILSERAKKRFESESAREDSAKPDTETNQKLELTEQEIVEPDFSHLQSALPDRPRNRSLSPLKPPPARGSTEVAAKKRPAEQHPPRFDFTIKPEPDAISTPDPANLPRKNIRPPKQDIITRRGSISIGKAAGKTVPVQTKKSNLILDQREYVDYTTVFGDTLHSLSIKFFGSSDYYLDIYLANRELLQNPSEVPVNKTLRIPVLGSSGD